MRINKFIIVATLIISSATQSVRAETMPEGYERYKSELASASLWSNVRGSDDSISKKSLTMVNEAFAASPGEIALTVVPNKFAQESSDLDYCIKLAETYKQTPVKFGPKSFASVEQFTDWFSQLAQGKGEEGKKLYGKCDQSCSIAYVVTVTKDPAGYTANVDTTCNVPRDKDDNQYILRSGIKEKK